MKILGYEIDIRRPSAAVPVQRGVSQEDPAVTAWLRAETAPAGTTLRNAYQQVVWVYRAVNVLAEQVASVPFLCSAGRRGDETLITSGPLLEFYDRPHPQISRFHYWELRVMWLLLRGECFRVPIYGERGGRRVLRQVLIADPALFQHVIVDNTLAGWRYLGAGPDAPLAAQVFLPEEIWHEKLPNPFDFWRGMSALQVAGLAVQSEFTAATFMKGILENNADLGVIIRTEKSIAPEQAEILLAALRERKRRAGTADRPMLLPGCTEIVRPHLSSSDLQFLENRRFSRSEICAAFGVPEEIITSTEHAKYDVMEGARRNFVENRVMPFCARLEAEEQQVVRAIHPGAVGWFDLDSLPILQQARRERLAAARIGFEMGVPFNQLNRVLDLGFKPLPWGDEGYIGGGLTPASKNKSQP